MKPEQVHLEATVAHRLLTGFVSITGRWPWWVVAAVGCLCALSLAVSWTRLEYRSQRDELISANKNVLQRWREYLAEFGKDEDIVVVVQGGDHRRMQDALEALAAGVRQHPDHFDRLFYKVDLHHLHDRALLYLSPDQLTQIQRSLD